MELLAVQERIVIPKDTFRFRRELPEFPYSASRLSGQTREVLRRIVAHSANPESKRLVRAFDRLFINHWCGNFEADQIEAYLKRAIPEKYWPLLERYDTQEKRMTRKKILETKVKKPPTCKDGCDQTQLVQSEGKYNKPKWICPICGRVHTSSNTRGVFMPTDRQVVLAALKKKKRPEPVSIYDL